MASRGGVILSRTISSSVGGAVRTGAANCRTQVVFSRRSLDKHFQLIRLNRALFGSGSDSITYSGGQASEGQGGYYGSGGARATNNAEEAIDASSSIRKKMIAFAHDVEKIRETMIELDRLEGLLRDSDSDTSKETIELKHSIKKLMTAQDVTESLNNLEINGEPVWGLSSEERELIMLAREKVNEC